MPFELKLAWKYFRVRRKSLARFTSVIAIVGIAAGVASLIIANALARGFSDEMQNKILANTAHITIFTTGETKIFNWRLIKGKIEKLENVKNVVATNYESVFLIGKDSTSYAVLRVVQDPKFENRDSGETGVSIGAKLAEKTNLKSGDEAEVIMLGSEIEPKRARVRVAGTFETGLYEYDSSWIYISPGDFAELKGETEFTPTILSVSVKDIYAASKTADEIRAILGENFKVLDWQKANQPLFAALSSERKVALAIISLIIFIAALNITTTLALLVNERRLDIAVLRTCGAKTRSLIFIFLLEGLFLGLVGILFGVIFGLLGCFLGNYFKVISLPAEVYSLEFIPFRPHLANVLLIICMAFLLSLAAAVYPALKASRVKPLENLRTR